MRRVMPKRSIWRVMQFDTMQLHLIKLAARVIELKTQLKIHLPSSAPRAGDLRHAPRPPAASRHLKAGAFAPNSRPSPLNLQRLPDPSPTNPPQRQRSATPAITNCNQNVSPSINLNPAVDLETRPDFAAPYNPGERSSRCEARRRVELAAL
jgi:hypothetical protein